MKGENGFVDCDPHGGAVGSAGGDGDISLAFVGKNKSTGNGGKLHGDRISGIDFDDEARVTSELGLGDVPCGGISGIMGATRSRHAITASPEQGIFLLGVSYLVLAVRGGRDHIDSRPECRVSA